MNSSDASAIVDVISNGHVVEISIGNGHLNLVTRDMLRALERGLNQVARTEGVRCVILHGGASRAFCAGSDIKEFAHIRADASELKILFEDKVLRSLARLPMPTIAAINGPALGGGLELAMACDLRVCARDVTLGLTESRLGGLAGNGSVRLARLVGPARAKRMLFTGAVLTAQQALDWGVIDEIASDETALDAARRLAAAICERGPVSNRLAKQLVDLALDGPLDAALLRSTVAQQQIFESDDLHEGVAAFFDKRTAAFQGH
jgi:enoyl-CoA hydratase/carnithine racemase